MNPKRHARPNRRKSPGEFLTLRSALLAFGVTFGAASTALTGCSPTAKAPAAPIQAKPALAAPGAQFSACRQHFPGGSPPAIAAAEPTALCFDAFAVLYSGRSKTPVYVIERLTAASVAAAQGIPRSDRFYEEARLPSRWRATLDDYRNSGYDRGHMAPAGDMPNATAKAQSFSLANMVPQHPMLNQKAWNQAEQATRKYAARAGGDVYVYTGPNFGTTPPTIGSGNVWVPAAT